MKAQPEGQDQADELKSKYIIFTNEVKGAVEESEEAAEILLHYDDALLAVKDDLLRATVTLRKKHTTLKKEKFSYQ